METGPRVLDLNKREGRPTQSLFSPPDFKPYWTWQSSLLPDPRLRVFSIPKSAAPKRQTEEPANGRTQSVNFVFARHSQPVCARFSRVPPSVSGAPFWQHEDEHYLSPSCVWHRYFFSLERLCTQFDLSCHKAGVSVRQPSEMAIRRGWPTVFGSSEWVGSPRHATLAEPSAILSVAAGWFPFSDSACSLNGAQNFKEPPRTSPPDLRDHYFPSNNLARKCSSALHRALSGAGERQTRRPGPGSISVAVATAVTARGRRKPEPRSAGTRCVLRRPWAVQLDDGAHAGPRVPSMHEYPQCECLARSPLVGWLWRRAPRLGNGRRDLPKDSGHPELDADRGRRGWPRYAGLGLTPSSLVVGLSTDLRWENSWWNVPRRGGGGVSIPGHYAGYRPGRAQPSTRPAPPPRWQPSCGPAASFCSLPPSFRASAGRGEDGVGGRWGLGGQLCRALAFCVSSTEQNSGGSARPECERAPLPQRRRCRRDPANSDPE